MFETGPYHLVRFHHMNTYCPNCQLQLEPEPGFYQGAMYVSYGFTVAFMVIISIILYYLAGNPSEWTYIGVVVGFMVIILPLNYRFSRILFLYMFGGISYDEKLSR